MDSEEDFFIPVMDADGFIQMSPTGFCILSSSLTGTIHEVRPDQLSGSYLYNMLRPQYRPNPTTAPSTVHLQRADPTISSASTGHLQQANPTTAASEAHLQRAVIRAVGDVAGEIDDPDDDLAPQVDPNLTPVEMWRQRTGIEDFPDVTSLLLSIIHTESMNKLFCDKKTPNKKVSELIARTMEEKGFPLAETTKVAAEKADQKYRNLKRRYKIYIDKVEGRAGNTGTCPADPPPYFDMLHPYLSGRADIHVNQSLLRSSLSYSNTPLSPFRPSPSPTPNTPLSPFSPSPSPTPNTPLSSHSPSPSPTGNRSFFSPPSTPAGPSTDPQFTYHRPPTPLSTSSPSPTPGSSSQSRFNYVKKTIRPQTSKNAELLAYLKESDEKEREIREKEVSGLTAFMTEMLKGMKSLEQQRSETLTTFKKKLNKKGRKRKQSSSDDEDD